MKVGTEPIVAGATEPNSPVTQKSPQPQPQQSSFPGAAEQTRAAEVQRTAGQQSQAAQELDLSFRKDPNGITYYVLTDPQSGEVVREVPAKEVRQVNGGIAQYLKSQAGLPAHKTDTKV